jgi:hypothetical protein
VRDSNDENSWAQNEGLQTKAKELISHSYTIKNYEAKTVPKIDDPPARRCTKNSYDVGIRTNKAQYFNDLRWLEIASPEVF